MSSAWTMGKLNDVVILQRGYDLPTQNRCIGKVPVVSSSGISDTHSISKVKSPGVVTGRYGTIGKVFYIQQDFWPLNTTLYVKDFKGNHPRFVFYLMQTVDYLSCSDKSGVPGVNRNDLHTIPVAIPPLDEQRAIARILGALDDKIELNRRMNKTLEDMAAAIFKSWFVDFDPVVAKSQGKQPFGMSADVAALFPDSFVETEDGPIPKGWHREMLDNELAVVKGRSYSSSELQQSDVALVTLKSINRGGGYRADGLKPYIGKFNDDQVIKHGEVVIAFTDVTQAAEVIGKPAIVHLDEQFRLLVASLDIGIVRPIKIELTDPFIYLLLKSDGCQSHLSGYTNGTTVLHLAKEALGSYKFIMPCERVLHSFSLLADPVFRQISSNIKEANYLATLRDMLLPKLLSGEIRVKQAEKMVEAVV